jgi:endo-1,4-beta-mannosidase
MFEIGDPFVLGVNYWPRKKAMYWWSDFDAGEVQEEFSVIRDLGLELVRIFLFWEDFQPAPALVNPEALRDLETTARTAADLGLKLDVTFFTGHMSGPNWAPEWMLLRNKPMPPRVKQLVSGGKVVNCGYRNPFTDAVTLEAERLLLRTIVSRLKGHPGIGMWNLGNEPDLFAWPPDAATGKAWVREMTGIIKGLDPDTPVTCGLHAPSLVEDNGLRVHDVFQEVDVPVMHGYPMYAEGWSRGPLDPQFVPFLCAATSALAGKPTLAEEFGGCTEAPGKPSATWEWTAYGQPRKQFMASEEDFADYIRQVLPNLVAAGSSGAVLWCYADYAPALWDRPPCDQARHERFFGLVRPDGSLKPHAQVLKEFSETHPRVQEPVRKVVLEDTPEAYYQQPWEAARALYPSFLAG